MSILNMLQNNTKSTGSNIKADIKNKNSDLMDNKDNKDNKDNIDTIINQLSNKYNDVNIDNYLKSLSEQDLIVLQIAVTHLQSSFNLEKSIGYLNWLNANS